MAHRTKVVDRTTVIPSPPSVVFDAVMSPDTAPLIDPGVREWRPDAEPIGVGTRFTIRGRLGVVPIRGTSEAVRWEPPLLAEFRSVVTWPAQLTAQHRFEPRADGGTNYTWSITFREASFISRPLVALTARLFARNLANQADALTSYLGSVPPPSND
jgi:hypothetical protein